MTVYESAVFSQGSSFADLNRNLQNEGFNLMGGGRVPNYVIRRITNSNPLTRDKLVSGEAELEITDHTTYEKNNDRLDLVDYRIVEPERVTYDPLGVVIESVPGRTSQLVRWIFIRNSQIDYLKYNLSRGSNSIQARTCEKDLANLLGKTPNQVREQYLASMIQAYNQAVSLPRPFQKQMQKIDQRIPMKVSVY